MRPTCILLPSPDLLTSPRHHTPVPLLATRLQPNERREANVEEDQEEVEEVNLLEPEVRAEELRL